MYLCTYRQTHSLSSNPSLLLVQIPPTFAKHSNFLITFFLGCDYSCLFSRQDSEVHILGRICKIPPPCSFWISECRKNKSFTSWHFPDGFRVLENASFFVGWWEGQDDLWHYVISIFNLYISAKIYFRWGGFINKDFWEVLPSDG